MIIVPGDIVGHDISAYLGKDTDLKAEQKYQQVKDVHRQVTQLFDSYFPDVPVLLTFGNNDTKYHYQPAFGANRDPYYDFIFQTWFIEHPGNTTLQNLDQIE